MKLLSRIVIVVLISFLFGNHNAFAQKVDPLELLAKHGFANYNQLADFTDKLPTQPSDANDKKKFLDEKLYSKVLGLYKDVRGHQVSDFQRSGSQGIDKALTAGKLMEFKKAAEKYFRNRDYALKSYKQQETQKENEQQAMAAKAEKSTEVEKKYSNVKGGWKYFKWGMSVDEAESISLKNGAKFSRSSEPESKQTIFYDPENRIEAKFNIARVSSEQFGKYKSGKLFFYEDRLAAVLIDMGLNKYIDDTVQITKALKETYPPGQIYKKKYPAGYIEHFKYDSKYLRIHTVLILNMYADNLNGVYYLDPSQIRSYKDAISNQENKARQEKEAAIKKSF